MHVMESALLTTTVARVPSAYHGSNGRFVKGNPGGPGNPHAQQVARLRSALHQALTEDAIAAVAQAMLKKAQGGDVGAARLLLAYAVGKPLAGSAANVVDTEITERLLAERLSPDELQALVKLYEKIEAGE